MRDPVEPRAHRVVPDAVVVEARAGNLLPVVVERVVVDVVLGLEDEVLEVQGFIFELVAAFEVEAADAAGGGEGGEGREGHGGEEGEAHCCG